MKPKRTTSLTLDSTCGELVDKLLEICLGEPNFVRPESCRRYIHLLPEFRNFVADFPTMVGSSDKRIFVAKQRIRHIAAVLHKWVDSYFGKDLHPILPSFALDAARFVGHSMLLHDLLKPSLGIGPIVRGDREERIRAAFDLDTRQKRDFTMASRLKYVVCRIPQDGQVAIDTLAGKNILGPCNEFNFAVDRCFLSSSTAHEWTLPYIANCEEPDRLDLRSEFSLPGTLLLPHASYKTEVPGHWVIASLDDDGNRRSAPFTSEVSSSVN